MSIIPSRSVVMEKAKQTPTPRAWQSRSYTDLKCHPEMQEGLTAVWRSLCFQLKIAGSLPKDYDGVQISNVLLKKMGQ